MHDLIAIEFHEYCVSNIAARQAYNIASLAAHKATIIVISHHIKAKIKSVLNELPIGIPEIFVSYNGIDHQFITQRHEQMERKNQFVFVSTIEPRKIIPC